ncbi:hypothetical protein M758_5G092500 [Ceratodon purpureus]|nr:hypothetical protein M758_5G092500 [Ceratodon purpureus]
MFWCFDLKRGIVDGSMEFFCRSSCFLCFFLFCFFFGNWRVVYSVKFHAFLRKTHSQIMELCQDGKAGVIPSLKQLSIMTLRSVIIGVLLHLKLISVFTVKNPSL